MDTTRAKMQRGFDLLYTDSPAKRFPLFKMFFKNHAKLLTSVKKMLVEMTIFAPSTIFHLNYRLALLQGHAAKRCQCACGILRKCSVLICMFADTLHTAPGPWWWGIAQAAVQVSHRNCSAKLPQTEQFLWCWGRCNLGSLTVEPAPRKGMWWNTFAVSTARIPAAPVPALL